MTRYEVCLGVKWSTAIKLKVSVRATVNAGQLQTLLVPSLPVGTNNLLVRAFDEAGNGSAVTTVRAVVPRLPP